MNASLTLRKGTSEDDERPLKIALLILDCPSALVLAKMVHPGNYLRI